jgi:hypothetical protein
MQRPTRDLLLARKLREWHAIVEVPLQPRKPLQRLTALGRTQPGEQLRALHQPAFSRALADCLETDTRAAAAHIVGVLWASASQGLTVKELRAAIGLSRELSDGKTSRGRKSAILKACSKCSGC